MKRLFDSFTNGGTQRCAYLSELGLTFLLHRCRQTNISEVCDVLGIEIMKHYRPHIEIEILEQITSVFKTETIVHQYTIARYRIDMYLPEYKLAIEVDEDHRSVENDNERQKIIIDMLGCTFIRIKPYEKNFNIFTVLGEIYKQISSRNKDQLET